MYNQVCQICEKEQEWEVTRQFENIYTNANYQYVY